MRDLVFPSVLFVTISAFLFTGLLYVHGMMFTSETEEALINENHALSLHRDQLRQELVSVNASLAALHDTDFKVERRWISDQTPASALLSWFRKETNSRSRSFRQQLSGTLHKTVSALSYAQHGNFVIGTSLHISSDDLSMLSNVPSIQPVTNPELTKLSSGYGTRTNPFHKGNYMHRGIDFNAPRGTPVIATASGTVIDVSTSDLQMGSGNSIVIDHGNGFVTRYLHLGEIHIRQGQRVIRGMQIASVGLSGGSISPHVHYEVLRDNEHSNPIHYILQDVSSTGHAALLYLAQLKNQSLD